MTIQAWYEAVDYPPLDAIAQHWQVIRDEYLRALDVAPLIKWGDHALHGGRWDTYGLWDLPHHKPIYPNLDAFSVTAALIEEHLPDHGVVAFSTLGPKSRIYPHTAHASPFIRAHLGLIIPSGDCQMWVAGTSHPWRAGEWLVFNEHLNHSCWNKTEHARTVLIVDVPHV